MKKAVIYTRVSTTEQKDAGYSLRDQEARLRKYCEIKNIVILKHFEEDYSAKDFNRPVYKETKAFIVKNRKEIDYLLVVKWDRFSRNAGDSYAEIKDYSNLGVEVNAIEQLIDHSIPENKLMLAFYLSAPEVENDRRSLNTKMGMRRAKREGRWVGTEPMGYSYDRNNFSKPTLVPNSKGGLIRQLFEQYATGAYEKEELRLKYAKLGLQIGKSHIDRILSNPVYCGRIRIEEWRNEEEEVVKGYHEPIITEELYDRVQRIRERNKKSKRSAKEKTKNSMYPLRGFLVCPKCERTLTGSGARSKSGKIHHYYHCQRKYGCKTRFRVDTTNFSFEKYLLTTKPNKAIAELYKSVCRDVFNEQNKVEKNLVKQIDKKLLEAQEVLDRLEHKFIKDEIDTRTYSKWKKKQETEISQLVASRVDSRVSKTDFGNFLEYSLDFILNIDRHYNMAPLAIKHKILGLIFPQKIIFDGKKYQTPVKNEVIELITLKNKELQSYGQQKRERQNNHSLRAARRGLNITYLT